MILALDSEAVSALSGPDSLSKQRVRRALTVAARLNRDALIPTVILAELYRGRGRNQLVDACLARERATLSCRDTDRTLARIVGGVLAAASAGSEDLADAHVIALAIERGGGVVLTSDADDLERLAASYRDVIVEPI